MAVLTTGHTFVDGQQVTSDRLNNIANAATFASAAVDGTTTQLSSGAIIVKDLGISAGKIATSAVTTAKLATNSVSTAKIIDGNVTKAKIEDFTNLTVLGNVSGSAATPAEVTIIDDDTMGTASATTLATSESIKAYVDTQIGDNNDLSEILANGNTTGANNIIVTAGQAITTDTVSETTDAAGVTVDSLLIKDGGITAAGTSTFAGQTISDLGTVTTANIDGGSIDGTTVGASSASTGAFTTLSTTGDFNADSGTLFVDASASKVGVLHATPDEALQVVGNIRIGDDSVADMVLKGATAPTVSVGGSNEAAILTTKGIAGGAFHVGVEVPANDANDGFYVATDANTDGTVDTVALKIRADGNVGIGTTSPSHGLDVNGTARVTGVLTLDSNVRNEAGAYDIYRSGTGYVRHRSNDQALYFGVTNTSGVVHYPIVMNTSSDVLLFNNEEGEMARFDTSGNLGIGTSPSVLLDIESETLGSTAGNEVTYFRATGLSGSSLNLDIKSKRISNGSDWSTTETRLEYDVDGSTSKKMWISFYNESSNTTDNTMRFGEGTSTEWMRIDNGNLGIGTTSPGQKLEVNGGNIEIDSTGGVDSRLIWSRGGTNLGWVGIPNWDPDALYLYGPDSTGTTSEAVLYYTQDTLKLRTNNSDAITIDSSQRVGIGTTSPSAKLQVAGSAIVDTNLHVKRDSDAWSTSTWINVSDFGVINSGGSFAQTLNGNGYRNSSGQWTSFGQNSQNGATQIWQYPAGYMTFNANSSWSSGSGVVVTERMRINSDGNIGINDATPSYKLDVNGTGHFVNDLTLDEDLIHNLGGDGALPGYSADGTSSYGTTGCVIEDGGVNGSTIYVARRNAWALHLASDTGSQGSPATVVRFADMDEQGSDGAGQVGSITITPSATAYNTSSDYRLKENNVAITDGIDRLKQLSPYRFNFKRDADTTVDGFFAHEVSDVVAEAITGTKDGMIDQEYEVSPAVHEDVVHPAIEATYDENGNELTPAAEEWTESVLVTEAVMGTRSVPDYQGIDQSKLVPLLTAALQEAVAKIEALEARVQTLEG